MKKSKKRSSAKRKESNLTKDSATKRLKTTPKSERKEKVTHPRKTRWETSRTDSALDKAIQVTLPKEEEKSHGDPPLRIKDLLDDKEKIVECLFLTITGAAFQELIPDYLKNLSIEELKSMCMEQIRNMSSDEILYIISGKDRPLYVAGAAEVVENADDSKTGKETIPDEKIDNTNKRESDSGPSFTVTEAPPCDVLELSASSNEVKGLTDEENQAPISLEEVAKDLNLPEKDAELLELEMRARAIRSLLKAKSQEMSDSDSRDIEDVE